MPPRLALLPLLLVPLVAQGQDGEFPLAGRVEGDFYHSATGAFRVRIPVLEILGGRILDTPNVVTFEDDFTTRMSIACFPLDLPQKWELESRGRQAYLNYFLNTFVLPDYTRRFPGTTVEASRFLPSQYEGTLAVFALLPGGSFFNGYNELDPDNPTLPPAVAKRGMLLFVHRGHAYVLTTELAERVTQPSTFRLKPDEENDLLTQRLLELAGRLVFAPAPRG